MRFIFVLSITLPLIFSSCSVRQDQGNEKLPFFIDQHGYVSDTAFHNLIRERKYMLVFGFDTIRRDSLLVAAIFVKDRKYGLINSYGEEIIKPLYDKLERFSKGSAVYKLNNKFGLISYQGRKLTEPKYYHINHFMPQEIITYEALKDGPAGSQLMYGLLDSSGKEITKPIYQELLYYQDAGIITYKIADRYGIMDKDGRQIVPPLYLNINRFKGSTGICYTDSGRALIHKDGKVLSKFYYDIDIFKEGIRYRTETHVGILAPDGQERTPPIYDNVNFVSKDLFIYEMVSQNPYLRTYGLMDKNLKEITKPIYSFIDHLEDKLFWMEHKGKWKLVNFENNTQLTHAAYDYLCCTHLGYTVVGINGKYGMVDKSGKELIHPIYDLIYYDNKTKAGDIVWYKKNEKFGQVDKNGKELTPPLYTIVDNYYRHTYSFSHWQKEGKYLLVDHSGKELTPAIYDTIGDFNGGNALFMKGGKWGFMNSSGTEITQHLYDTLITFEGNATAIPYRKNNKYGVLSKSGKELTPPVYDLVTSFSDGIGTFKINNQWGVIDDKGSEIMRMNLKDGALYVFPYEPRVLRMRGISIGRYPNEKYVFVDRYGNVFDPEGKSEKK